MAIRKKQLFFITLLLPQVAQASTGDILGLFSGLLCLVATVIYALSIFVLRRNWRKGYGLVLIALAIPIGYLGYLGFRNELSNSGWGAAVAIPALPLAMFMAVALWLLYECLRGIVADLDARDRRRW